MYSSGCTVYNFIRPPGTIVRKTLRFTAVYLLFFSPLNLRGPSTDHLEILLHGQKHVQFYNPV